MQDDPWQVIPTAWVEASMARWKALSPKGEMMGQGVDVARGGKDKHHDREPPHAARRRRHLDRQAAHLPRHRDARRADGGGAGDRGHAATTRRFTST